MMKDTTVVGGHREMIEGDLEDTLVQYIAGMQFAHIPEHVVEATKWFLLDTLGVAIAGSAAPGCLEVMHLIKSWGGKPESTLWGYGERVPAPHAALGNGVLIHALDLDDTHVMAGLHANAVVLPAALAVAEQVGGVPGRDFLCAVTVGVDMACRLGLAARNGLHLGWLPTSLFGIFGATAAAGKILGLDEPEMRNALGIAYAQAFGNRQSILEGALIKRLLPGFAARDAVVSACLAKSGITGPADFLTGKHGMFALYSENQYDAEPLTEYLGQRFYGVELLRKSYPCCSGAQGAIEASIRIPEVGLVGLTDIERVIVYAPEEVVSLLGRPFGYGLHPQVDAQFNIPYLVATAILTGDVDISDIEPDTILSNQEVIELSKRVKVVPRETEQVRNVELPVTVEVVFKDGRIRSETIDHISGSCTDDDWSEVTTDKFVNCVRYANPEVSAEEIERVSVAALHLEEFDDVGYLVETLEHVCSPQLAMHD